MADHAPRVINLNFNRPSAGQIAAIFMGALLIVLLIAVLLTSSYTVGAESEGVVLRFGKFLKTVEPRFLEWDGAPVAIPTSSIVSTAFSVSASESRYIAKVLVGGQNW